MLILILMLMCWLRLGLRLRAMGSRTRAEWKLHDYSMSASRVIVWPWMVEPIVHVMEDSIAAVIAPVMAAAVVSYS